MPYGLNRINKFKSQQSLTVFNKEKMQASNMRTILYNPKGFTLVEMLVAMAAGLIVMIAIYTVFVNHQRSHVTEQQVVDMQQNARAAISLMKREIRMAGYDPFATDGVDNDGDSDIDETDGSESAESGFREAQADLIRFESDVNGDGEDDDTNEDVRYRIENGTQLMRYSKDLAGVYQNEIIAYDIEAVGFAFAFDDDENGELDVSDNNNVIWAIDAQDVGDDKLETALDTNDDGVINESDAEGGANLTTISTFNKIDFARIQAVRIWLFARTRHPIKGHIDNRTYVVGATHRGPADGDWDPRRKRMLLTTTIYCRNMGI